MKNGKPAIKISAIACLLIGMGCCLLTFSAASFAAFAADDKGTSTGQFLKLGAGARAEGLGEAYSAAADDASAVYWNPAALSQVGDVSATFMHAALLADISYEYLGYGQRLGNSGVLGLGVQYLSMPVFHETDQSGFETGAGFSPGDMGVTLAYSFPLGEKYSAGVSGKYIRSKIDKTASTFASDLGILARPFGNDLRLSFVVQNLGGSLKFEQKSDPLPLNVKAGGSLPVAKDWLVNLDVNFPRDNRVYAALGTEYRLKYDEDSGFAGRLGFNTRTLGDIGGFSGISAGAGIDHKQFRLDYAFLPFGALGMTHRISVTVGFGKPGAAKASAKDLGAAGAAVKNDCVPAISTSVVAVVLAKVSDPKVLAWIIQLKSPDWEVRRKAVFELGKAKAIEATEPLLELLDDENSKVCGAAALALGHIGDKRALEPLMERLEDESAYVRASAARALANLGEKGAAKALKTALQDGSSQVRKAAGEALKELASK